MNPTTITNNGPLDQPLRMEQTESGVSQRSDVILATAWQGALPDLTRLVAASGVRGCACDDILQDVYIAAMRSADPELRGDDLRRWLFRVTVNRCHEEHRKRSRWKRAWLRVRSKFPASNGTTYGSGVGEELARTEAVGKALDRLPEDQQILLVMRYFLEMDSKRIGEILERPSSTIRSQLRDARQRLAAELGTMGFRPEGENEHGM